MSVVNRPLGSDAASIMPRRAGLPKPGSLPASGSRGEALGTRLEEGSAGGCYSFLCHETELSS